MVRPAENPIPADEDVYRGLEHGCFTETDVIAAAIDSAGSSVHRSKYATPEDALTKREKTIAVAVSSGELLAPPLACKQDPKTQICSPAESSDPDASVFVAYVWDVPEEGDDHAEVRLRRRDEEAGAKCRKPGVTARLIIFDQLARRFRLLARPRK
jgi:hypothetical protein